MRKQFEKLPEIAARLSEYKIVFHDNDYAADGYSDNTKLWIALGFVNGAWYAFQEQQKKIKAIKAMAERWENTEYTYNSDSTDTKIEQMRICGREIIQELLK